MGFSGRLPRRRADRSLRMHAPPFRPLQLIAAAAALSAACGGSGPFRRPSATGTLVRDEASGRTFSDCRAAFAAATAESVLVFGEGVFACGPEVQAASDWLVVRGAGAGSTFLDSGADDGRLHPAAIRPGRALVVEDLAFGGLSPLPTAESTAVLVRTAIATDRPALLGDAQSGVVGSVAVVHSVLAAGVSAQSPADGMPKPIAFAGNGRVAVVESVLLDVEQELERYPAPGSIAIVSPGVETAFARHAPAGERRRDASPLRNVPCGHPKHPLVRCGETPLPEDGPVAEAARVLAERRPLAEAEGPLRAAAKGFSGRFRTQYAAAIRQPEVFWFDDGHAAIVEAEAEALAADPTGKSFAAVRVRAQAAALADRCADASQPMKPALDRARALDRLLPAPEAASACVEKIKARVETLSAACTGALEWAGLLEQLSDADAALETGRASADACRAKLRERMGALRARSGLVSAYLREVDRTLALGAPPPDNPDPVLLDPVVAGLPYVEVRTGRAIPTSESPLLDQLVRALQQPGAGDGRRLVETSAPCALGGGGPGGSTRATGAVQLSERLPNASENEEPRVVAGAPVEATVATVGPVPDKGGLGVALTRKCDEAAAAGYGPAVLRYVREELARQSVAGPWSVRAEAELALLMVSLSEGGRTVPRGWKPRNLPVVPAALVAVDAVVRRDKTAAAVAAAPALSAPGAPAGPKPPAPWTVSDLELNADVLSRGGSADLETCAFLLPHLPWEKAPARVDAAVSMGAVAAKLRCRADPEGFELSLWVEDEKARAAVLAALVKQLDVQMGASRPGTTARGTGRVWSPRGGRLGFAQLKAGGDPMLGYILVPLGSVR